MSSDHNDSIVSLSDTLNQLIQLKFFLLTAPNNLKISEGIHRHTLPNKELISCVVWRNVYFITGTDIVRCLTFRFEAFGREITNRKKFEEGIFSDLRNLKCDNDAVLEQPKSEFLDFLYRNNCVRTQKKQKIFYWFSVNHDRLFQDALERDLKKDLANKRASTTAIRDPALSFHYDSSRTLHDQLPDIIEKFPRPLAELTDASSIMSSVTLPSGHIIQIPPHFYPNAMPPGFPAPPEMQPPMFMNAPRMLPPTVINSFAAGQEMGFPPAINPTMMQPVHHHHHQMIGLPVQAVNNQGIYMQEMPGAYPQQFQMPMPLSAQGAMSINGPPVQYQSMDVYQQQVQAQALAQAQAQAAAAVQAQPHNRIEQILPKAFVTELSHSSEVNNDNDGKNTQSKESEELESDFPLDYAPHVDDDQLFGNADLSHCALPERNLVRKVSSEPFDFTSTEKENPLVTFSHDETKLEVMYKQNEDGTFMSVLVPNGAASSMVDYANSARAVKTPSTPQESQALAIYNSAIDDSAAADTNTPTNSSKEGTLYEELTTEKSTLSPEKPREDCISVQNTHSALLPKSLKSKISKASLHGTPKSYRTNQQLAVSGAIAGQMNSATTAATSNPSDNTTASTTSNNNNTSNATQDFNGPTFLLPTPSESGCRDATQYQQDLEVTSPSIQATNVVIKPEPQSYPQQILVNGQVQYFTAPANGGRVPAQLLNNSGGTLQFVATTCKTDTDGEGEETTILTNSMAAGSAPSNMGSIGALSSAGMDDFMYLNTDLEASTDFSVGFNWSGST